MSDVSPVQPGTPTARRQFCEEVAALVAMDDACFANVVLATRPALTVRVAGRAGYTDEGV